MSDIANLDAVGTAEAIADKSITPREAVETAISRIERTNAELNAVIHTQFDSALEAVSEAKHRGERFFGVPTLLKDLGVTEVGEPDFCGLALLKSRDHRASVESHEASLLKRAGFIILGRTNTPELGLMTSTEPSAFGPTRNPWAPEHSAGGSSGGAGAAVAARMVPVAGASDGGGSIRVPASANGLFGLKPSRGRVSLGPTYSEGWAGLSHHHMLTRSVRDSAALLDILARPMPGDPYLTALPPRPFAELAREPLPSLKIAVLTDDPSGETAVEAPVRAAVLGAVKQLEDAGHRIVDLDLPLGEDLEALRAATIGIIAANTAAGLAELERSLGITIGPEDVEPGTAFYLEHGRAMSAADYLAAVAAHNAWRRKVETAWADIDVLVCPTLPFVPPAIGVYRPEEDPGGLAKTAASVTFTIPFNVTGQPAVSLPLGQSPEGLPIGVQAVAARNNEALLFQLGHFFETAMPWAARKPQVCA
ncbi:MAG: amidase [Pseudomonadota bacterium]